MPINDWDVPLPLGIAVPEPRRAPQSLRQAAAAKRPKWRHYHPCPHRCDDCLLLIHEGGRRAPLQALWERRQTGVGARYLCTEHAEQWRRRDRMGPLPERD